VKHLSYGLLYGMGPNRLAAKLGCDVRVASEVDAGFKASIPQLMEWCRRCVGGYVARMPVRRYPTRLRAQGLLQHPACWYSPTGILYFCRCKLLERFSVAVFRW
jgi:hypothetical protein